MKFKIGDRVRAIGKVDGEDLKGKCGTVIQTEDFSLKCWNIGVEFDEPFECGHDCDGMGRYRCCRWGKMSEFEPISNTNQKIVITTDGKETLARLYEDNKVVKKATAKCSPEDTFDFKKGADLAYERLMEEQKYFMGKAVCIKAPTFRLTVGKIYDFSESNGCGKNDVGGAILDFPKKDFAECEFLREHFLIIKE